VLELRVGLQPRFENTCPVVAMSFGFSVGDFIAFIGLVERVANEIREYKNAPQHFQCLAFELRALHSTLQTLLSQEPVDSYDAGHLERIRAMALHCQQPIQAFRDKMSAQMPVLGTIELKNRFQSSEGGFTGQ
jgi:hypothetical protein